MKIQRTGNFGFPKITHWILASIIFALIVHLNLQLPTPNSFSSSMAFGKSKKSSMIVKEQRITKDPEEDFLPSWSPDGKRIAFASYRSGTEEIWVMDVDGKNLKQLTVNPHGDWSPAWSPDGKTIAFTSDRSGINQLWLMNRDGSNVKPLTSSPEGSSLWNRDPAWGPHGKKIIFTSNRSGKDENWIMDLVTGKEWSHTEGMAEHWHPSFSPDGTKILFSSNMTGEWGLWLSNLKGEELVRMVPERRFDNNPAASWSPDGKRIVFRTAEADLWIMNSDGTHASPLTKDGKVEGWRSSWSPDSRRVAYTSSRSEEGGSDIWIITLK